MKFTLQNFVVDTSEQRCQPVNYSSKSFKLKKLANFLGTKKLFWFQNETDLRETLRKLDNGFLQKVMEGLKHNYFATKIIFAIIKKFKYI